MLETHFTLKCLYWFCKWLLFLSWAELVLKTPYWVLLPTKFIIRFRRLCYCGKQQKPLDLVTQLASTCRTEQYWKRCWRASVDGRASSTFHSRCDGKGPTVTIIRVGRYIFGGYTSLSWGTLIMKSEITLPQFLLTFAWGLESTENGQKFLEQIWKNHNVSNFFDSSPPHKQRQTPVYIRNFSRISTFISLWGRENCKVFS